MKRALNYSQETDPNTEYPHSSKGAVPSPPGTSFYFIIKDGVSLRPFFAHIMWIRLPWPERLKTPTGSAT
ncbi:hypothetical protein SLEP1_g60087 [Rubroshorea leprosula]|uniref:Uncharacterized protein n=1 Tax=Rubroshorea leprosula TaxID=152421 RepID=A0AAV5MVU4_9ROSI|nr:hypothetical protein SLEP1_g60087 [Rubroshorea leprosula]